MYLACVINILICHNITNRNKYHLSSITMCEWLYYLHRKMPLKGAFSPYILPAYI